MVEIANANNQRAIALGKANRELQIAQAEIAALQSQLTQAEATIAAVQLRANQLERQLVEAAT